MRTHKSTVITEVTQVRGVRVQCGTGLKRVDVTLRRERKSRKCRKEAERWRCQVGRRKTEKRKRGEEEMRGERERKERREQ